MSMDMTAFWDALGWSILHSLWQGALIGLVVYGLRLLATDRRAWLRYLMGMGGLIATFSAFMVTFVILMTQRIGTASSTRETLIETSGEMGMALSFTVLPTATPQSGLAEALVPWLGMVWAVGFACLSLQAYRAWTETCRLAKTGLSAPEDNWSERFTALLRRSRSSQRIRLFVSEHVSGPLTLGALKPVVLVPAGFLTSMPPAHVEAILLHELAHIQRHDFLMGLIQTAIRTVLYFNPAVIILSRQVDEDREQACDDMAVAVTGQPADLVRGLAALRLGSQTQSNDLIMAADGGPLLTRLNRLMGRSSSSRSTGKLSAAAISALLLGSAAYSTVSLAQSTADLPEPAEPAAEEAWRELPDTVVKATPPTPPEPPKVDEKTPWEIADPKDEIHVQLDGKDALVIKTADVDGHKVQSWGDVKLPPMPEMPAVPELPPMPEAPIVPPVPSFPLPNFSQFDSEEAFEAAMDIWSDKMDDWGDEMSEAFDEEWEAKMERWGEEVEARFEGDWEAKMERWGEDMEVWGEAVEKIAERAGHSAVSRMADIDVDAIRERAILAAEQSRKWTEEHVEADVLRTMKQFERNQAQKARAQAQRERAKAQQDLAKAAQDRAKAEQDRRKAQQDRAKAIQDQVKAQQDRVQAEQERLAARRYAEADIVTKTHKSQGGTTLTFKGMKDGPTVTLNGRAVNVGVLHADLMSALKSDGLMKKSDKSVDLALDCEEMTVNGRAVKESQAHRYRTLLQARGFDLDQVIKMSLQKDGLSIKLAGKGSKSSYSYAEHK